MSHANAALTPRARLRLARLIVDEGWPVARAAERYDVSWPTAKRWAERYRRARARPGWATGPRGRTARPNRTPAPVVRKIVHLRWKQRLGPVADRRPARAWRPRPCTRCWSAAGSTGSPTSTGPPANRSAATSTPIPGRCCTWTSRSSATSPTAAAGATSAASKATGTAHATTGKPSNQLPQPKMGTAFVHTVLDDHSRVAYAEIHDDETAATAAAVLRRAVAWFAARGVTVERVLSDNGSAYRVPPVARHLRRARHHRRSRPGPTGPRPTARSNASTAPWPTAGPSSRSTTPRSARRAALPAWLHHYNHHRPHTAIGRSAPITRLTNLSGQYS